jgi:hypothetical protein
LCDVYVDSMRQLHGMQTPDGRYQFNKCMTLNGYDTEMMPDGRYAQ